MLKAIGLLGGSLGAVNTVYLESLPNPPAIRRIQEETEGPAVTGTPEQPLAEAKEIQRDQVLNLNYHQMLDIW